MDRISIYTGKLTTEVVVRQINVVRNVFNYDKNYCKVLKDRIIANGFTDQRLIDAVNYVIDNFKYGKTPNIADFIQFDRQIELMSYNHLLERVKLNKDVFRDVVAVNTGLSVPQYVWKWDYAKYPFWDKWTAKTRENIN